MPVKLTSEGIQFSDGTTQTRLSGLEQIYTIGPGYSSYSMTGLSSYANRVVLHLNFVTWSSGPQTPTIKVFDQSGNLGLTDGTTVGEQYTNIGNGSAVSASTWSNFSSNNLWKGNNTYATYNNLILELDRMETTLYNSYTYTIHGTGSASIIRNSGIVNITGRIYTVSISTGSSGITFSGVNGVLWQG